MNVLMRKLQEMFEQVSNSIEQMLKALEYIYKSHGIKFYIADYKKSLLRMLTPFQLLSYYQLVDNDELLDKNADSPQSIWDLVLASRRDEGRYSRASAFEQKYTRQSQSDSIEFNMKKHSQFHPSRYTRSVFREPLPPVSTGPKMLEQKQMLEGYDNALEASKGTPGSASLDWNQELKICQWIKSESEKGLIVSKTDVMRQANMLTNSLQGTSTWCKGFFKRYPEMFKYIKRAKPTQRKNLAFLEAKKEALAGDDSGESENFGETELNDASYLNSRSKQPEDRYQEQLMSEAVVKPRKKHAKLNQLPQLNFYEDKRPEKQEQEEEEINPVLRERERRQRELNQMAIDNPQEYFKQFNEEDRQDD